MLPFRRFPTLPAKVFWAFCLALLALVPYNGSVKEITVHSFEG